MIYPGGLNELVVKVLTCSKGKSAQAMLPVASGREIAPQLKHLTTIEDEEIIIINCSERSTYADGPSALAGRVTTAL